MSCTPLSVSGGVGPFPACQSLHTFLFSNPYQHTPNAHPHFNPDHTFDGQPIPPYRPAIVHAGTGAQISWARVRADSLRVARAVREITGEPVRWEDVKERVGEPVHAPRTTLLLHLPNTLSWPIIAFGALGALCTVSPVSPLLTPRELAYVLAKSRPQILVSSAGSEGYDRLRSALALLLDAPHGEGPGALAGVPESEVRAWAKELARVWDAPCESLSWKEKRVWTVDVAGEADYYGTGRSAKGLVAHDSRDWTNLLEPPVGHGHGGTMDNLQREAFEVKEFEEGEQERRVAFLLWSSGTTGTSKGVLLSHRNLISNSLGFWHTIPAFNGPTRGPWGGGERWVALAPWCHIYGLSTLLLPTFTLGVTLIMPPSPRFHLPTYLRLLTTYRATFSHIAPPVAVALRHTPCLDPSKPDSKGIDLSSVKAFVSGGAPVPVEVIRAVYKRTGRYIQIGYGTTEGGGSTQARALDLDEASKRAELGSCGLPHSNSEVRILPTPGVSQSVGQAKEKVKQESEGLVEPLEPCEPGEVLLKGPTIMLGYYSGRSSEPQGSSALDIELTSQALTPDGWYKTGDEGVLDKNGNLWITGRTKEIIKVKGFQVPPAELDALFASHPRIADAAACGWYLSSEGTDVPVLFVVPSDPSIVGAPEDEKEGREKKLVQELHGWVQSRTAYYKWPRFYVFTPTIPKNPSGKILRKDLPAIVGTRHATPKSSRERVAGSKL